MSTYTTSHRADEINERLVGEGPTRVIPRSPLPRPDETARHYFTENLPPRVGLFLPDLAAQRPAEVLPMRAEPAPERPTIYRGRRRAASSLPGWAWAMIGAIVMLILVGCGVPAPDEPKDPAPPTTTLRPPVAPTTPAREGAKTYGAGTYEVGKDIKAGTYVTTAPDGLGCTWQRLKAFDGEITSVIAADVLAGGARGRVTVKATDKGVELAGDCVWTVAK